MSAIGEKKTVGEYRVTKIRIEESDAFCEAMEECMMPIRAERNVLALAHEVGIDATLWNPNLVRKSFLFAENAIVFVNDDDPWNMIVVEKK